MIQVVTHVHQPPYYTPFNNYFFFAQNLESDRLGHIDSPEEISDMTEVLQGESLLDDISSVLGHDFLGTMQDSTITDDTTTLCGSMDLIRRRSSKKKAGHLQKQAHPQAKRKNSTENDKDKEKEKDKGNQLQFGFENMVFEMDNRCDDQKVKEPVRYCSLAKFVEGNDIARKSFKVRKIHWIFFLSLKYFNGKKDTNHHLNDSLHF